MAAETKPTMHVLSEVDEGEVVDQMKTELTVACHEAFELAAAKGADYKVTVSAKLVIKFDEKLEQWVADAEVENPTEQKKRTVRFGTSRFSPMGPRQLALQFFGGAAEDGEE